MGDKQCNTRLQRQDSNGGERKVGYNFYCEGAMADFVTIIRTYSVNIKLCQVEVYGTPIGSTFSFYEGGFSFKTA